MGIERKKKRCVECGKEDYLFSKGRCKYCASKEYAETMKRRSGKTRRTTKTTSSKTGNKPNSRTKRKKRRKTVSQLKAKVWRVFSQWVRLYHSDKDGYCTCCTCGKRGFWYKDSMEAGHFRSRRYSSTLFHHKNVHPQCTSCNGYNQGESYLYGKFLDETYGEGTADELVSLSREEKRFTVFELEQMYNEYSLKVSEIRKKKKL